MKQFCSHRRCPKAQNQKCLTVTRRTGDTDLRGREGRPGRGSQNTGGQMSVWEEEPESLYSLC